jgi:hypothetical protein
MKTFCMQPSSTGAGLSGLLYLDLHWASTDVRVVYSKRHMPAKYFLRHLDHDFDYFRDCYIVTLQGENCSLFLLTSQFSSQLIMSSFQVS